MAEYDQNLTFCQRKGYGEGASLPPPFTGYGHLPAMLLDHGLDDVQPEPGPADVFPGAAHSVKHPEDLFQVLLFDPTAIVPEGQDGSFRLSWSG